MINDDVRQRFLLRSKVINAIRRGLEDHDYVEVETPTLWSDAGGANATPFVTHLKALDQSMPLFLRVAPELFLKVERAPYFIGSMAAHSLGIRCW